MISKLTLVPGNCFFPCSCDPNKYPCKTSHQETEPKRQKVMTQVPQQIFYRGLKDKLQDFGGVGEGMSSIIFFHAVLWFCTLPGAPFLTPGYSTISENLPFLLLSPCPASEHKQRLSHKELLMSAGNPKPGRETASVAFSSISRVLRSRHTDSSWRTGPDLWWYKQLQPAFPSQRFPLESVGNSFCWVYWEQKKVVFLPDSSHTTF